MLNLEYRNYTLDFKVEAGTSRGKLTKHSVIYLKISDQIAPNRFGLGEVAPLPNLSIDDLDTIEQILPELIKNLSDVALPKTPEGIYTLVKKFVPVSLPSLRMGLETALLDLINGGGRLVFQNDFYEGTLDIPINGLIWMGEVDYMKAQIKEKLDQGFRCIKLKIGAIDFDKELELIKIIRDHSKDIVIRVDANGAFATNETFPKLSALEGYGVHSIEQPIMAGQYEAMQLLCKRTPVPIALDEELIGIGDFSQKQELLKLLRPQYIILKPTLLGGFSSTIEWIKIANQMEIGWWLTSALESNIGLNAISQFAAEFPTHGVYHGLGTGQLYSNNVDSPLEINGSYLSYNTRTEWEPIF